MSNRKTQRTKNQQKIIYQKRLALFGVQIPTGVLLAIISLTAGTVFTSINISAKGAQLVSIEKEIGRLDGENRELKEAMVSEMSLTVISEEAEKLGLQEPTTILYLDEGDHIANLR